MKLVINGRFLTHKVTGVERYARELLMELDKIAEPNMFELAVPSNLSEIPHYKNIKIKKIGKLRNRLWEHISFPLYVLNNKAISLNLCNVSPLLSPGIVCIHDMKIKATPQFFNNFFLLWYQLLFFNAIKRAKMILTVSEFSKSEIMKYYRVEEKKISVIPNGWQHFLRIGNDQKALQKYGVKRKNYYFSMSSLEPNKNFKWIVEVAKKNPNEMFVVSGSVNSSVFSNETELEKADNIKFIGYASDEEAKVLMRECKVFLYPTFYEGFGIPPLEALSTGTDIIVSDTECMREVFEDSVYFTNPHNYNVSINEVIQNKVESPDKILNKYSWRKSAASLLQLCKNI